MFTGENERHSTPAPSSPTTLILVGSARRSSKAPKTPFSVPLDPFQEISDQCKVSTSQEEIFATAIAATNSKRKSPIKDDSQGESPATRNLGLSDSKRKRARPRGPSNSSRSFVNTDDVDPALGLPKGKLLAEMDLGFFKRIKFLISTGKFPDLQSLKDSGVLWERDLGFFERMRYLISRGHLPDLGFPEIKGDSPAPAALPRMFAADAPDLGLSQMNLKECGGVSEGDLRFYDRIKFLVSTGAFPDLESLKESGILLESDLLLFQRMMSLISKGELPDLGFLNTNEDSRPEKSTDEGPEMDIQSPMEIDARLSKSKGESLGGFSSKDLQVLQQSVALLLTTKDASAMNASDNGRLDKTGAYISKSMSLIEKNSGISTSGNFPGPEKNRPKSPAHGEEDVVPRDEFARFGYCESGKPPNQPSSTTQETESHTPQTGRILPPSLQGPLLEKAGVSSGWAKSRDAACQKSPYEITKKLLDFAKGVSKESDRYAGNEDILQVAERAGYTFPRPRWWPPEENSS